MSFGALPSRVPSGARASSVFVASLAVAIAASGCGGGRKTNNPPDASGSCPLGVSPTRALARRVTASDLPSGASEYLTWKSGDYLLANDRVAIVIEDVGLSDLYDPWGGRPVGITQVADCVLTNPADFGEMFFFIGRATVMTDTITVVNDGSDGRAAVIRAEGLLRPMPFIDHLLGLGYLNDFTDIENAYLEYVLEPGADHVDVFTGFRSTATEPIANGVATIHGFMYTKRMPVWASSGAGFDGAATNTAYAAFVDDDGASYTYSIPGEDLDPALAVSGFVSNTSPYFMIPPGDSSRVHARITIGGRGLDGALVAHAAMSGRALRTITGRVVDTAGNPVAGARVHVMSGGTADAHRNRVTTAADGTFAVSAGFTENVELVVWRRGDRLAGPFPVNVFTNAVGDLEMPPGGFVVVAGTREVGGTAVPARIQVRAAPGNTEEIPTPRPEFGEHGLPDGILHQVYALPGEDTPLRLPIGQWEVMVSHGYEYELHTEVVTITDANCNPLVDATACPRVAATLARSVDTAGVMCADFHIHTMRSNDAADDPSEKLVSAAAEGLEIPCRSEHEFVEGWDDLVEQLGLGAYLYGLTSLELTTFERFGHFGAVPLDPDPSLPNGGAIAWQTFPTPNDPLAPIETRTPQALFSDVLARPEQPALIINHPDGLTNYFGYVGLNSNNGQPLFSSRWDERFHAVEVFNNDDWVDTRDEQVAEWLSLLDRGLRVFAVGSSDSHGISGSPVGYPRTCMSVGADTPPVGALARRAFANDVRDAIVAGRMTVSGGIYVSASVAGVGPGGTATGQGTTADVQIRVQAASWVDVDAIEIVVDGETVATIPRASFTGGSGTTLHSSTHSIDVASGEGSYVVVAAYGDAPLASQSGKTPFGMTNPIFVTR